MNLASLIINIIAGELVEPARRTVVFGMLQGTLMLGQGIGYLGSSTELLLETHHLSIPSFLTHSSQPEV